MNPTHVDNPKNVVGAGWQVYLQRLLCELHLDPELSKLCTQFLDVFHEQLGLTDGCYQSTDLLVE